MDTGWHVPCPHPIWSELPQPSDRVEGLAWAGHGWPFSSRGEPLPLSLRGHGHGPACPLSLTSVHQSLFLVDYPGCHKAGITHFKLAALRGRTNHPPWGWGEGKQACA